MNKESQAFYFCVAAHEAVGQVRKYTGEPYFIHCTEVANTLRNYTSDRNVIAAGYLHDVLEDTQVTEMILRSFFGDDITNLVLMVTDVSKKEDGNREVRKAKDLEHLKKASSRAKMIKLADLMSNTSSIVDYDVGFGRVYLKEKRAVMVAFEDEMGHTPIWKDAMKVLKQAEEKLKMY